MIAQKDVRVTIRVDKHLKESADLLFDRLGLNMSAAFNIFLRKAVSESGFGYGLSANSISDVFNTAVQNAVNTNQQKGLPIAKYDRNKKQAYLELADGTREYVNE